MQRHQFGELAQIRRYRAVQPVAIEVQLLQVGEVTHLHRYLTVQRVATEVQKLQIGEVAQISRYLPAQRVQTEIQIPQIGEIPQFRGNLTAQSIGIDFQAGDAAGVVCCDAVPCAEGLFCQPVGVVRPVLAAGGVVKGHQRRSVGGERLDCGLGRTVVGGCWFRPFFGLSARLDV